MQLRPEEFIQLTADLYGEQKKIKEERSAGEGAVSGADREAYVSDAIWRTALFGPGSLSS
jgi:hypothetical protein